MRYSYIWKSLVNILLISDQNSPDVPVRYNLDTVFARVRGSATLSKLSACKNFPKLGPRRFVQYLLLHYPRGVKEIMDFPPNFGIFNGYPYKPQGDLALTLTNWRLVTGGGGL